MYTIQAADITPKHFRWEVRDGVGTITLDRPDRKNPLTFESYAEMRDLFRQLPHAADVKVVIMTGAGGNFCSGGDVHDIIGPLTGMDMSGLLTFTRMTGDLVKAMRACPQPIVAAIDGICVGAGACIAMGSDIRYGTPRAKVGFLFVRVGLAGCDMGACGILPRIIGHGRASELLYTGRMMTAAEGMDWGWYAQLLEPEAMMETATKTALTIASGPTFAHSMTKRMLHAEWNMAVDDMFEAEAQAQAICMQTEDFRRAYEAFVAKRDPEFAGN